MDIQQAALRAGVTAENIKFYQSKGLIAPAFGDYNIDDIVRLRRISMLRQLGVSIEDIHSIVKGEKTLPSVMQGKINPDSHDCVQDIYRTIRDESIAFEELRPEDYTEIIDKSFAASGGEGFTARLRADVMAGRDKIPYEFHPWRRYFARALDTTIYSLLFDFFLLDICGVIMPNRAAQTVIGIITGLILTLFIEPLLLSKFGATLGKLIMGIRVLRKDGEKLTYSDGFDRTASLLWKGMAVRIPLLSAYFLYRSYRYGAENILPWDEECRVEYKSFNAINVVAFFAAHAVLLALAICVVMVSYLPRNHGDLTVGEFVENYNRMSKIHGESSYVLDGNMIFSESNYMFSEYDTPKITYTEENGVIKSITMTMESYNQYAFIYHPYTHLRTACYAFAGAEKGIFGFFNIMKTCNNWVDLKDHSFELYGIKYDLKVDSVNTELLYGEAVVLDGEHINITMTMTKP